MNIMTRDIEGYDKYDIGIGTYGPVKVTVDLCDNKLVIGKYCSFAEESVIILGGGHRTDWITTYPFPVLNEKFSHITGAVCTKGDVIIGNDVWVGYGALILNGVTIGDGAVIGAHAVVTKNVPPYAIVVGNPGRVVKYRFEDHLIKLLLKLKWWDWPSEKIEENMAYLCSNRIIELYEKEGNWNGRKSWL